MCENQDVVDDSFSNYVLIASYVDGMIMLNLMFELSCGLLVNFVRNEWQTMKWCFDELSFGIMSFGCGIEFGEKRVFKLKVNI